MAQIEERKYEFSQIAGNLSLDFVNTAGSRVAESVGTDHIGGYGDLIEWAKQLNVVTKAVTDSLDAEARTRPGEAAEVVTRARELRESIFAIIAARQRGQSAPEGAVATLNAELGLALGHLRLVQEGEQFGYTFEQAAEALDCMLWPVARSAADLLTQGGVHLERVRECAGDTCGWLFIDMSRNHSRQWCDMRDCGNRTKARKHYQRKKALGT